MWCEASNAVLDFGILFSYLLFYLFIYLLFVYLIICLFIIYLFMNLQQKSESA